MRLRLELERDFLLEGVPHRVCGNTGVNRCMDRAGVRVEVLPLMGTPSRTRTRNLRLNGLLTVMALNEFTATLGTELERRLR